MINDPLIFLPIDPRKINLSLDPLSLCRNIVNCTRLFFQHEEHIPFDIPERFVIE